jgi:hypothetical protein
VYDIVSDIIGITGILFRSYSIVGFWVVAEYVKGMYVVYELIIEEWYVNPLKLKMLSIVYLSTSSQ